MIDLTPYRKRSANPRQSHKPSIMVRLPEELHAKLKDIAHKQHVSLNSLCLAALESASREFEQRDDDPSGFYDPEVTRILCEARNIK